MATAKELANRLRAIVPQVETETARIIQRSQPLLEAKQAEFRKGEAPDGSRIGYYRNPDYRLFKQNYNPLAGGTVDLFLTGQFYRGLFVEKSGKDRFLFDSHDDKAPELFAKYGQDLRGLNDETWLEIQKNYIAPELVRWIKRQARL